MKIYRRMTLVWLTVVLVIIINALGLASSTTLEHHINHNQRRVSSLKNENNALMSELNTSDTIPPVSLSKLNNLTKFIITAPGTDNSVFYSHKYHNLLVVDASDKSVQNWISQNNLESMPSDPIVVTVSHKTSYDKNNISISTKTIPTSSANNQTRLNNKIKANKKLISKANSQSLRYKYLRGIIMFNFVLSFVVLAIVVTDVVINQKHLKKEDNSNG